MCNHDHDDKTYRHATFTRDDTNWNSWPPGTDPDRPRPMVDSSVRTACSIDRGGQPEPLDIGTVPT